jgi:hypothetical protein
MPDPRPRRAGGPAAPANDTPANDAPRNDKGPPRKATPFLLPEDLAVPEPP